MVQPAGNREGKIKIFLSRQISWVGKWQDKDLVDQRTFWVEGPTCAKAQRCESAWLGWGIEKFVKSHVRSRKEAGGMGEVGLGRP